VQAPPQTAPADVNVTGKGGPFTIVAFAVAVLPSLTSVTVNVYVPGQPVTVGEELPPGVQEYINGPTPPETEELMLPLQAPAQVVAVGFSVTTCPAAKDCTAKNAVNRKKIILFI
jgi:hypothetical protein